MGCMERRIKRKARTRRFHACIRIEGELAEYLERLAEELPRDRTFLINAIISEYAQRHRGKLAPPLRIIPM